MTPSVPRATSSIEGLRRARVMAGRIGGEVRISQRGVPLVVLPYRGVKASLCWFSKHQLWRLFWPFPHDHPDRLDFDTDDAVVAHLQQQTLHAAVAVTAEDAELDWASRLLYPPPPREYGHGQG